MFLTLFLICGFGWLCFALLSIYRYPEELTEDQAEELGTLIDSYNRLVDPKEMGSEYKVFAISSNGKVPVAF